MNKAIEWGLIVVFAVFLIYFVSPFASQQPDGLEKTAGDLGAQEEQPAPFVALGDYSMPLSALVGGLLVFLLVVALLWPMAKKK